MRATRGRCLAALAIAGSLGLASPAMARDPDIDADLRLDDELEIEVLPVFHQSIVDGGLTEVIVQIKNNHSTTITGAVVTKAGPGSSADDVRAPFELDAGAATTLHLPLELRYAPRVLVMTDSSIRHLAVLNSTNVAGNVVILDLEETPRLGAVIGNVALNTEFRPTTYYGGYAATNPTTTVVSAERSLATGDLILPRYVSGFRGAQLAVIPSDVLGRLSPPEAEALSGFVMDGGTLAIDVVNGEDLALPIPVAMLGGVASPVGAFKELLAEVHLTSPAPPAIPHWTTPPTSPGERTELSGYQGGNLHPCSFGACASYGLGQVTVLGFSLRGKPLEDPWVQLRMLELSRRAYERFAISSGSNELEKRGSGYGPGGSLETALDPEQSSHAAVGTTAVVLCLYAILAGPLSFFYFRRRGKPLSALKLLPVLSLVTFLFIVGIGFLGRGTESKIRRLTFIEAGAGMSSGMSRRYSGYYSPGGRTVDLAPRRQTSTIDVIEAGGSSFAGWPTVDTRGMFLQGVVLPPAQTVLIREEGIASLGGGVSITSGAGSGEGVLVKNDTGRLLRALLVRLPSGNFVYAGRLGTGETLDTSSADVPAELAAWQKSAALPTKLGRYSAHALHAGGLAGSLGRLDPEAARTLQVASRLLTDAADWFPDGLPSLIAVVDGGASGSAETGFAVESDQTLLHVVGYGGGS